MKIFSKLWNQYQERVRQNCLQNSNISDGLSFWRNQLFANIMIYLPPLGLLLVIPSFIVVITAGIPLLAFSYILAISIVGALALYQGFTLKTRKIAFLGVVYFVALVLLAYMGNMGSALTYFYGITIFALLIYSKKSGYITVGINALIFIGYAVLIHLNVVEYILRDSFEVISWLTVSSNSLILSIVSVILLPLLFDGLQQTIDKYKKSQDELNHSLDTLKQKNKEIKLAHIRYNTVCKLTNEVIWEWNIEENTHLWSGESKDMIKVPKNSSDVSLESWFKKIHPNELERVKNSFLDVLNSKNLNEWEEEYRFKKEDGSYAWVLDRGYVIRDEHKNPLRFLGGMLDISSLKQNELIIRDSLREKETLLAEIHHRVKNNLAAVTGMLQLQLFQEENEELSKKLIDSMMRIKSIANIHEQLYQSKSFSKIDLGKSLEPLASAVIETMKTDTEIDLKFDLIPVELSVSEAIPCSLIVNEVITNIVKHAFTGKKRGQIYIQLSSDDQDRIELKILDDGNGLPKNFPHETDKKLGMELIITLSEQIKADYEYSQNGHKTMFRMVFSIGQNEEMILNHG